MEQDLQELKAKWDKKIPTKKQRIQKARRKFAAKRHKGHKGPPATKWGYNPENAAKYRSPNSGTLDQPQQKIPDCQ